MELNEYRRKIIARSIFKSQDLGGSSVDDAIYDASTKANTSTHDPLTMFLVDAIQTAGNTADLETTFEYAIAQLNKAKLAIGKPEL